MKLFGKDLNNYIPIIAEVGVNHEGSFDNALKLITLAHQSGADAVKFQSYTPERYVTEENKERYDRVKRFQLTEEEHLSLIAHAKNIGIYFFSTPLTEDWVPFLSQNTSAIKIASGDITFETVIRSAANTNLPVIISTGGANINEINQAIKWFTESSKEKNISKKLILMHCVSAYPTPLEKANLHSINYLKKQTGLMVGYSNHVKGTIAPLIAMGLGANIIEVHFTDSRENKIFHDHALSLNPSELKDIVNISKKIKLSLGEYKKVCLDIEKDSLLLIRKGLIAAKEIKAGKIIDKEDLMYARPASDFDSNKLLSLIGKVCSSDIEKGHKITKKNISI